MKTKANGIEIGYDVKGQGPWVAFCHSLGLDRSIWSRQVEDFARGHTVLTWDARGHGETSKAPGPCDFQLLCEDLASLLDALNAPRAAIIGLSMGGGIAMAFAADHPDRTSALVLSDTTPWYGPEAARSWAERIDAVRRNGLASIVETQAERWFTDAFRMTEPELVHPILEKLQSTDLDGYVSLMEALGRMDLRPELRRISCPTLVVVGEGDPATPPPVAEEMQSKITGAKLLVIDRAKHLAPYERAGEFNRAVLEFLSDVRA